MSQNAPRLARWSRVDLCEVGVFSQHQPETRSTYRSPRRWTRVFSVRWMRTSLGLVFVDLDRVDLHRGFLWLVCVDLCLWHLPDGVGDGRGGVRGVRGEGDVSLQAAEQRGAEPRRQRDPEV